MRHCYAWLLLFCISHASAEVLESLESKEYAVHVQSGQSLLAAINKASPIILGEQIYHGHTKWYVRWNYR